MLIEIELKNYVRMAMNTYKVIKYKPESGINIILGTNGHGKSSLLKELSPLPAELKKEFKPGGYKKIKYKHNNKYYILTSTYDTSKHSFLVDGKELNPGGTKKVQLTLVKEHFSITPKIHDVMIGKVKFTNMSIAERKDWFTTISSMDYDYILSVFQKLRTRHRDLKGTVKLLSSKLASLKETSVSKSEYVILEDDLKLIDELIVFLLKELKEPLELSEHSDIEPTVKGIKALSSNPIISLSDGYTIDKFISNTNSNIRTLTEHKITTIKFLNDYKKQLETLASSADKEEFNSIVKKLNVLNSKLPKYVNYDNFKTLKAELPTLRNLTRKVDSDYNSSSMEKLNDLKDQAFILNGNISEITTRMGKLLSKLEDAKNHDGRTCKNCGISCNAYSKDAITEIEDRIKQLRVSLDKNEKLLSTKIKNQDIILENLRLKPQIDSILSRLPKHPINDHLTLIGTDAFINVLNKYIRELDDFNELIYLTDKHKEFSLKINASGDAVEKQRVDIISNIKKLEDDINNTDIKVNEQKTLLDRYKIYRTTITVYDRLIETLEELIEKEDKLEDMLNHNLIVEYILGTLTDLNTIKEKLSKKIKDNQDVYRNIEELTRDIDKYNDEIIKLNNLIEALSPNDGLIGHTIKSFLGSFTDSMNKVINDVWDYELEIQPVEINSGDLTYKFPVKAKGKDNAPDVADMSTSMIEMTNLAFRLVSAKFLKLDDYPLFLDEFASEFDPLHRIKAYDSIDKIKYNFSHIFIVSHYMEIVSRFKGCDILIVSDMNLETRGMIANKNVEFI